MGCRQHSLQACVPGSPGSSASTGSSQLSSSSTCTAQGEGFTRKGTTCPSAISAVVQFLCFTYGSCSVCMYPSAIQLLGSGQNTYMSPFRVVCNQGFVLLILCSNSCHHPKALSTALQSFAGGSVSSSFCAATGQTSLLSVKQSSPMPSSRSLSLITRMI